LIHSVTKSLAEHSDKLDEATRAEVKAALDEAQAASSNSSAELEDIKAKSAALNAASMKIGQSIYSKSNTAGAGAAGGAEAGAEAPKEEASDAEFNEKEKK
jgi:molecular chaperone DnaK